MEHIIDATNQKLGRLASGIALVLQGKDSPEYNPRLSGRTRVVVKNVSKLVVTGRKYKEKVYYRHTGYVGHLKKKTFKQIFEKAPQAVLQKAVYNMLPDNKLRAKRMKRLTIEK